MENRNIKLPFMVFARFLGIFSANKSLPTFKRCSAKCTMLSAQRLKLCFSFLSLVALHAAVNCMLIRCYIFKFNRIISLTTISSLLLTYALS